MRRYVKKVSNVDDKELQQLVEHISLTEFGKKFYHKAYFNHRLRTTGGRYLLQSHHIEINPKYYVEYGLDELVGIIKHELCHYHLHIEGKGYQHKDRDFKELLKKVNAPRFCKPLKQKTTKRKQYIYCCNDCSQVFIRYRKMNTKRYVCGKCRGKIYLSKKG